MADGLFGPDDAAAEDELLELVARGEVHSEPLGDGTLWRADGARFTRTAEDRTATTA